MINKTLKYLSIITLLYSTSCTNAPRYNKSDFSRQTKGNKISNKTPIKDIKYFFTYYKKSVIKYV